MNLLAIDTSTDIASISLLVAEDLLYKEQGSLKTHTQFVLTMIDELLVDAGLSLKQLDGIVFGCGPGSFTGLRIACSVAKGLAYAHDLGLIPVSTLAAIAYAIRQNGYANSPVLSVLDARMQQMYWSYFAKGFMLGEERVDAVDTIQIPKQDEGVVLAGVGIDLYWGAMPAKLQSQISVKIKQYPNAASMIGLAKSAQLKAISAAEASPVYVRNQVTHR